jgi:hypothetical protein
VTVEARSASRAPGISTGSSDSISASLTSRMTIRRWSARLSKRSPAPGEMLSEISPYGVSAFSGGVISTAGAPSASVRSATSQSPG